MRPNFTDFSRKFQYPLLFCLGTMPLPVCAVSALAPGYAPWCLLFGAVYLVFAWCAAVFSAKARLLWAVLGSLSLLGLAVFMAKPLVFLLIGGIFAVLLLCSLSIGGWRWDDEISLQGHLLGLAVYLLCYLVPWFMGDLGQQILRGATPLMGPCLWLYSIFIFLSMNRDSLFFAAKGKAMTSKVMHRRNTVLIGVFVAVSTGLSLIPGIVETVVRFLLWLFGVFIREPEEVIPPTPPRGEMAPGKETAPTPWEDPDPAVGIFWEVATQVFLVLLVLAAVVMAVQALRSQWPKIRKWLQQFVSTASEDYTDEITDLRSQEQRDASLLERLRTLGRELQTGELPPDKKIRRRYRQIRRGNRQWSAGTTARESLPQEAAAIYEKARYSTHPVTQEDYREFKNQTKKL